MSWKTATWVCLAAGMLMQLPSTSFAQPECDEARRACLDYCHYAPENQWTSGFKCKRECNRQLEACRRGMRGYPPRYGYGDRGGYGAVPAPGGAYGYGAAPQQPAAQAPYGAAAQPPAGGYGQPGYPAYGAQAPYARGGYAAPSREEPYTGP